MKHHFVPQFYLKGFTDRSTPALQTPYVWVADITAQTIKKRAPENAATLTDYYALQDETGMTVQDIEEILSGIESDAARVITALEGGRYYLTPRNAKSLL